MQIGPHSPQNGILGDARRSTAELGKRAFDMKVDYAVRQIRSFLAGGYSWYRESQRHPQPP